MAGCERCWSEAAQIYRMGLGRGGSHVEVYQAILDERDTLGLVCSPEEQAGDWWDPERGVDRREASA